MLDPKELKRQVVAGFNDRNIMAGIIETLSEEINKVNKTKASKRKIADFRKELEKLKNE